MKKHGSSLKRWICSVTLFTLLAQAQAQATEETVDVQTIEQQLRRQDKALAIQERIQPVGRVHVQPSATGTGDASGNAAPAQALTATPLVGNAAPATTATTTSSPIRAPAAGTTATPATATTADKTSTGEKIYSTYCVACHATGVANAPKLSDKTAWQPRIAAAKTTAGGFLATVKKGKAAMPPMGMCANCSDDDLQAAINYMLEKVK